MTRRFSLVSIAITAILASAIAEPRKKKFEYKYSFKGPHLARENGDVFYWKLSGNTIASSDQVRLTASMRSQKGQMSTKAATDYKYWQIDMAFRITGRARVGADGLAIWFTKDPIVEGPVFGAGDYWNGLGLFLDSFDNDGKSNNPYVLAMNNNGTMSYDHASDGYNQMIGGCLRDFRNRAKQVRARIIYYEDNLEVYFNTISDREEDAYELCLQASKVEFPSSGYFGLSAATGGLADDHDVLSFLVTSLNKGKVDEEDEDKDDAVFDADELSRLQKEFEQYDKDFEMKHESYKKEHPDPYENIESDSFEDWKMSQVLKGQADIIAQLRNVDTKIESKMEGANGGGGISMEQYRIIIENQNRILQKLENVKSSTPGQGSYEHGPAIAQMEKTSNRMESLVEKFESIQKLNADSNSASTSSSTSGCIPAVYFGLFLVAQIGLVVAFLIYRSKREASAKKLF